MTNAEQRRERVKMRMSERRAQLTALREIRDNPDASPETRLEAVKQITEILEKHPYLQ